jgi:Xaa-Pro aminopeptidase
VDTRQQNIRTRINADDLRNSMLLHEKADQAALLLAEVNLDCWLTFARETGLHPDPGVEQVVGADVVRNSAFLFGVGGERIAIVANFDTSAIRSRGVFHEVVGYDEDIRGPLLHTLRKLDPQTIGLNYSTDDVTADGLTYGHWLLLQELLRGTPYVQRLTRAAPLLSRLRGRKSHTEVGRIRAAVTLTEQIIDQLTLQIRPGRSERDLSAFVHTRFAELGVSPSWPEDACPVVNTGPNSDFGHSYPSPTLCVETGHVVHVDLGLKYQEYCSDLQRVWYVRRPGETAPPEEVRKAFETVKRAIDAASSVLRPGVQGFEVDAVARQIVVADGYPEFKHGLGHGLGRAVHDGGTMLGPRWPCYGSNPERVVEAGNVFTLELSVMTSAGLVGLEEDVLVTAGGCEFLSARQQALMLI